MPVVTITINMRYNDSVYFGIVDCKTSTFILVVTVESRVHPNLHGEQAEEYYHQKATQCTGHNEDELEKETQGPQVQGPSGRQAKAPGHIETGCHKYKTNIVKEPVYVAVFL